MRLRRVPLTAETHAGKGEGGEVLLGSIAEKAADLRARYAGEARTVYLDPPFYTGNAFVLRQRYGEEGWATGKPTLTLPAYSDRWESERAYLSMLEEACALAYDLLRPDGSFFLHVDPRMGARARLLLDALFGPERFVNEIIWAYQSGGRATGHFSRKHDVILFYRKREDAYFNLASVGVPRARARANHMRRQTDGDGRVFRSIRVGGKEYRYYDDEPAFPGDVWDDVSHLQQKDPQRTGYDSQKPLRLLERILLSTTAPGDLAVDLFAGSGTTAAAAALNGRRFLALDESPRAVAVIRKRLLGYAMRVSGAPAEGEPLAEGAYRPGLGYAEASVTGYRLEDGLCPFPSDGDRALDQLSAGYLRADGFHAFAHAARTKKTPALPSRLEFPMLEGVPAVVTVDALCRRMAFALEE